MKLFVLSSIAAAVFLFPGCADMSVSTNLDPENFVTYAKPGSVEVYTDSSILDVKASSLGYVTGFACQEKESDYPALPEDARTDARIKAADLGADAIVFSKCITLKQTKACTVSVTCYGEAFKTEQK